MRFLLVMCFLTGLLTKTAAQQYDCEIRHFTTHIVYQGKNITTTTSYTRQINNAKGTNYAHISIPYKKDNPLKNLTAWIEDMNGNTIRKLKNKDIEHANRYMSSSFHSDMMEASFKLIHNEYPYLIKYRYVRKEDDFISLISWSPALFTNVPVVGAHLTLEVPKGTNLSIHEQHLDAHSVMEKEENTLYQWHSEMTFRPERETYAPAIDNFIPYVEVVPEEFHYRLAGKAESWLSYGNWLLLLNNGRDVLTESDKEKVHELTDHLSDNREKIKTLYHYLQDNTRYINVSIDHGGLCPYPASYVGNNKYGDCKALTNYMKALLNEAGIYSIYTDVYAGAYPSPIITDLPSQQFNHVILCVPQPTDTIWLECTSSTLPFNYLGTFTQGRQVLVAEKDQSRLVHTPSLTPQEVEEKYHHQISINADGNASFVTNGKVKGAQFEYLKDLDTHVSDQQKTDIMDRLRLIRQSDIKDYKLESPHRDSTFINLTLEGQIHHLAEKMGNKMLLQPLHPLGLLLEEPEKRKQPVCRPYPLLRTDSVTYILPQTIAAINGLKDESIDTNYGHYHKQIHYQNNTITVIRRLQLNAGLYNLDEYEAFYNFIDLVSRKENQKALITYN